ncbi:MAG: hypothetical protein HYR97_05965 [Candidatus Melainabacteria bacterium]|nr:hypothetical protein [Candidatus Melainabacteria bacterium]
MKIPSIHKSQYGYSEVYPWDDCAHKDFQGFKGKEWAEETAKLSNHSVNSYIIEAILKIPSYFLFHSDLQDKWWAKGIFTIERITGTFGDMFRNMIYGHKNNNGDPDDNIGAEIAAGANEHFSVGVINNHMQTKVKFLSSILGLIDPEVANDLEWAVIRAFDGIWWRSMGMHLAYGPNFGPRVLSTILGSKKEENADPLLSLSFIKNKFIEHCTNLKKALGDIQKHSKDSKEHEKAFLGICEHADKITSSFMPIVNALNVIGDFGRPIARRLGIEGIPRNTFRILSVIDRPFFWITDFFRYYLPEKSIQKGSTQEHDSNIFSYPDLLAGSIVGDMLDFGLLVFEDKIKDTSGNLNHVVEIARRVKDSANDIYFSRRRKRAYSDQFKLGRVEAATAGSDIKLSP